jgi:hypothetical protein
MLLNVVESRQLLKLGLFMNRMFLIGNYVELKYTYFLYKNGTQFYFD